MLDLTFHDGVVGVVLVIVGLVCAATGMGGVLSVIDSNAPSGYQLLLSLVLLLLGYWFGAQGVGCFFGFPPFGFGS